MFFRFYGRQKILNIRRRVIEAQCDFPFMQRSIHLILNDKERFLMEILGFLFSLTPIMTFPSHPLEPDALLRNPPLSKKPTLDRQGRKEQERQSYIEKRIFSDDRLWKVGAE